MTVVQMNCLSNISYNLYSTIIVGFSAAPRHDPHILYTLSAVQILVTLDALPEINVDATVDYVVSLHQKDGSFFGDKWGETDTRFSFCAVATLALLVSCYAKIDSATEIAI